MGCNGRKCPCRMWISCGVYVDMQRKEWRIKKKEYDYIEWYNDNFRADTAMIDIAVNG